MIRFMRSPYVLQSKRLCRSPKTVMTLDAVSKSYDKIPVLKNISFDIKPGERVSLLGPGGCGKSTILKILLGLTNPDRGEVSLMTRNMVEANEREKQLTLRK